MNITKCRTCGKIFNHDENDGICPKCGAYNSAPYFEEGHAHTDESFAQRMYDSEKYGIYSPAESESIDPECMKKDNTAQGIQQNYAGTPKNRDIHWEQTYIPGGNINSNQNGNRHIYANRNSGTYNGEVAYNKPVMIIVIIIIAIVAVNIVFSVLATIFSQIF